MLFEFFFRLLFAVYVIAITTLSFNSSGMTTEEEMLIYDEGISLKPYKDIDGSIAIGVGRNLNSIGISISESMTLLKNDIDRVHNELSKDPQLGYIYLSLDINRQIAIRNMCFNMGITRLRGFKKMWIALKSKDYIVAHDEALDSRWSSQLPKRSMRIALIIKTGRLHPYK